jgi:hypothetical protein
MRRRFALSTPNRARGNASGKGAAGGKDGKLFIASNELQNTLGTKGKAEGAYKLKVQICNPSCP